MTVRVGVVGVGSIGSAHVRSLARSIAGSTVTAVHDANHPRAAAIAQEVGARAFDSAEALIVDDRVDAVVIASPDAEHVAQVRACIDAGKPALCEKPLSSDPGDALDVMAAEVASGRRLVALGFMRRFDPGYVELKRRLDSGEVGEPLIVHCVHRNQRVGRDHTTTMSLTNSAVHEIDINRWLLGDEFVSAQVLTGRPTPHAGRGTRDPLLILLLTTGGVIVEIEHFANAQYGYDVRCEVVATAGTLTLDDGGFASRVSAGMVAHSPPQQWMDRFGDAFNCELQTWVDAVAAGAAMGPSLWDGYAAAAVAQACVTALQADQRVAVSLVPRPGLYREGMGTASVSSGRTS